ncbi:NADH-quinone oxidoreductase subunit F [candidate division WOR-3 bacterium]|uniref:NADH-quinone oxidoreductase subunit F n=1 Tax=candidate division WOR-3 bacterium TaxID=2052148 RepID=A0A660SJW2_UNCW3|nr:MAG: NADH-quinone oxidoreductase subunit F [candidate division WOR-3 bacterium]
MRPVMAISAGTCGLARGAGDLVRKARAILKQNPKTFQLRITGCHGFCETEPNCIIFLDGQKIYYQKLRPEDLDEIFQKTIQRGEIIKRLTYYDPVTGKYYPEYDEIPFFKKQKRLLLSTNPLIDPTRISDYLKIGGYQALRKVLSGMAPEAVIEEITASGLRGRGGAGFPTGRKWKFCRMSRGRPKYIICNADEGDPGAYMDRSLLEGNPHSVIEGMIIGAYAIGASEGIIYVRNEYPLAVRNVRIALAQARKKGFLGRRILDKNFDFDIRIVRGAGAFVCGEETALIASIEGRPGRPRPRPPYPAEKGLFGKPTNINNVETWANVPLIINNGAAWYRRIGTRKSKGTKIFSLVGKIRNTGLVEVPMGMTLKEIIYEIGGGVPDGRFKAVQTGGPSGGCIPKEKLDLRIDYEGLTRAGSMMGSGGMIVMDERTCMVDVARYFLTFTQKESCGKCPPCRIGTKEMVAILERITRGEGEEGDLDRLKELGEKIKLTALCGLGQTAPNPVLTTIRYFEAEYLAHIRDKRCPALVCKDLISYVIDPERCTGCQLCLKNCPEQAIVGDPKGVHRIIQDKCIRCGICQSVCPPKFSAIKKVSPRIDG